MAQLTEKFYKTTNYDDGAAKSKEVPAGQPFDFRMICQGDTVLGRIDAPHAAHNPRQITNETRVSVSVIDIGRLANIIVEVDLSQSGLSPKPIKDLVSDGQEILSKMLGENGLGMLTESVAIDG